METLEWPTSDWAWWWMRCRLKPRGKWRVLLVGLVRFEDGEFIQPFEDRNCYPRSFAQDWHAEFVKAEPPPAEWRLEG